MDPLRNSINFCLSQYRSNSVDSATAVEQNEQPPATPSARRGNSSSSLLGVLLFAFVSFSLPIPSTSISVSMDLHTSQKKCFGEQLGKHVLLMGEFKADGPIQLSVTSPTATIFQDKNKQDIKTAFTTQTAGTHMFCIQNLNRKGLVVQMNIVWGPEARDYSQIAKRDHLDDVTLKLRKIEDQLKYYHNNVLYMKTRESQMRHTNDSTATRVIGFSVLNMFLLIGSAIMQAYYFRNFFRSKKII